MSFLILYFFVFYYNLFIPALLYRGSKVGNSLHHCKYEKGGELCPLQQPFLVVHISVSGHPFNVKMLSWYKCCPDTDDPIHKNPRSLAKSLPISCSFVEWEHFVVLCVAKRILHRYLLVFSCDIFLNWRLERSARNLRPPGQHYFRGDDPTCNGTRRFHLLQTA